MYLNVVIQADTEQEYAWLDELSSEWKKATLVRDPVEFDLYLSDRLGRIKAGSTQLEEFKAPSVVTGYELSTSLIKKAPVKGVYRFDENFVTTPAVQGIIAELDMIRWSGQAFPGGVEPTGKVIINLLRALTNFTD